MSRILPQHLDNGYRGHVLAIWFYVPVLVMKTGIALGTIFNSRNAVQEADGIPLDSFGAGGAETVVALFAIWGLAQFVISVFGILALIRYRAMIPLMFTLLLLEHLARKWILTAHPVVTTGTPPGLYINYALLALMIAGLGLSLWRRADVPVRP